MRPIYAEEIEIIGRIDGSLVCQMRWRDHVWEQDLPRGFDRWDQKAISHHLGTEVIPNLYLKLLKAQQQALSDPATAGDDCIARIEYDEKDTDALNRAQAKRERKANKLHLV